MSLRRTFRGHGIKRGIGWLVVAAEEGHGPAWDKAGHALPSFDQTQAIAAEFGPNLGRHRPGFGVFGRLCPMSAEVGPDAAKS